MRTRRRSCTCRRGSISSGSMSAATAASCWSNRAGRRWRGFAQGSRPRCVHYADRTRWRSSPGSTPSSEGGRPIIGARYPRGFASLDHYLWKLLYKWSTWRHSGKPKRWIVDRYFGKRNRFRNDHWVFGAPGTSAYVVKFAWTDIVRHVMVKGGASPDDPDLAEYSAPGDGRSNPHWTATRCVLTRQDARCPLCGDHLLSPNSPPSRPSTGNGGGCRSPARRSPRITSFTTGDPARPTMTKLAWYTPPATAGISPASAGAQHSEPESPQRLA